MTLLLLLPGLLAVIIEITIRHSFDLVLIFGALNLLAGILAAISLRWAPLWAVAATLLWVGSTLTTWLLYQLVALGLPTTTFTALSVAIAAALMVPVITAWLHARQLIGQQKTTPE